jgi:hypothetical protein
VHWRYELPLKRTTKCHIQKLLAQRHDQILKGWLRYVENINGERKIYGMSLIGCEVGNEKGSNDLVKY